MCAFAQQINVVVVVVGRWKQGTKNGRPSDFHAISSRKTTNCRNELNHTQCGQVWRPTASWWSVRWWRVRRPDCRSTRRAMRSSMSWTRAPTTSRATYSICLPSRRPTSPTPDEPLTPPIMEFALFARKGTTAVSGGGSECLSLCDGALRAAQRGLNGPDRA